MVSPGATWCIWGPKAKTEIKAFFIFKYDFLKFKFNYLILDVKLLLINMNYVDFFWKSLDKKFDKTFHTY